jgi:CheY-like chemotaxis protein
VLVTDGVPRAIHVLLVEDDELIALNTRRALRRSRAVATVTLATDGREALDRLLGGTLARDLLVVITDLRMPRMTGLELIVAIRAERTLRDLPVVVLTTSAEDADRQAAVVLGVAGYFVKASVSAPLEELLAWLDGYQAGA